MWSSLELLLHTLNMRIIQLIKYIVLCTMHIIHLLLLHPINIFILRRRIEILQHFSFLRQLDALL